MKQYKVEIKGTAPMLQNRLSRDLNKEFAKVPTTQREDWEDANWHKKLYTRTIDGKEVIVQPDENIHALIVEAGKKLKTPPPKTIGKFWGNYLKSCIIVQEPAVIENKGVIAFGKMVNGNPSSAKKSSKVYKVRPMINDWHTTITFTDTVGYLTKDMVRDILETGGLFVGLSDWRPQYGRFVVTKVTEKDLGV